VHQVGSKDSGSQNFSFLALKAEPVGEVQIMQTATTTARDRRKFFYRLNLRDLGDKKNIFLFIYKKSKYAKIKKNYSLKSCGHLLGTTFVLRLFKILSADGRASASKVENKAKKVEIFQYSGDFFKS
jgi:hypothetical protein